MTNQRHDFSAFRVTDSVGYLLRRAQRASAQRAEEVFVGEELSFTQWIALIHLRDGLVDTGGGLARCLGHDSGATTRMLDQLEERRLLARARSTTDRRVIHLLLTPEGRAAADRLIPRIVGYWEGVLDGFTPEEVGQFRSLLERLVVRLGDAAPEGTDS